MTASRLASTRASAIAGLLSAWCGGAAAAEPAEQVVVTATRTPESVFQVPAEIEVISGDELRARDG